MFAAENVSNHLVRKLSTPLLNVGESAKCPFVTTTEGETQNRLAGEQRDDVEVEDNR